MLKEGDRPNKNQIIFDKIMNVAPMAFYII